MKRIPGAVLFLLLVAGGAEIAARWTAGGNPRTQEEVYEASGLLRANRRALVDAAPLTTDARGQREFHLPRRPDSRSLLLVGGEFVTALGTETGVTLPAVLDALLAEHAAEPIELEVHTRRGGFADKLQWIRERLAGRPPEWIVLQIEPQDLGLPSDLLLQDRESEFVLSSPSRSPSAIWNWFQSLRSEAGRAAIEESIAAGYERSSAFQRSREAYRRLLEKLPVVPGGPQMDAGACSTARALLGEIYHPERHRVQQEGARQLQAFLSDARAAGSIPVVLSMGPRVLTGALREAAHFSGVLVMPGPPFFLDGTLRVRGDAVRPGALLQRLAAELLVMRMADENLVPLARPLDERLRSRAQRISDFFSLSKGQETELHKRCLLQVPLEARFVDLANQPWVLQLPGPARELICILNQGSKSELVLVGSGPGVPPSLRIRARETEAVIPPTGMKQVGGRWRYEFRREIPVPASLDTRCLLDIAPAGAEPWPAEFPFERGSFQDPD